MSFKVVITDYYYPDLEEEKKVFEDTDIEIVDCNGKCETEEDVIEYAKDADAVITQFTEITEKIINKLEKCKVIVRYAIGLDVIDIEAATENEIMVCNVPDYSIEEVSTHALALMLSVIRKIPIMNKVTASGSWSHDKAKPLYRPSTMNLGVIAYGRIAREFVRKASALNFEEINVFDPYYQGGADEEVNFVELEEVLKKSDVISIHAPANKETENMFDEEVFNKMKDGTFLINTSRGGLVNEKDLAKALKSGKLAGAGIDVLKKEDINKGHPLLGIDNVVITPHMAWYTVDSIAELQRKVAEQVKQALLEGDPAYRVNEF